MNHLPSRQVSLSDAELMASAALVDMRFDDPADEARRIEITRRLLAAAMSVEHELREQTRCALVNHCGTHGTSSLPEATQRLFNAFLTYAGLVQEIAALGSNFPTGSGTRNEAHLQLEVA